MNYRIDTTSSNNGLDLPNQEDMDNHELENLLKRVKPPEDSHKLAVMRRNL